MKNNAIKSQLISLALETTGRIGSVAIGIDGNLSDEKTFSAPLRHNAELFDAINLLLNEIGKTANQTQQVFISIGPGSFTGIRISVTLAKMMALAADCKIVAVNTSDAMALNIEDDCINKIATVIDAKRGQFFIAVFKRNNNSWEKILSDCMLTPEQFKEIFDNEKIYLLGEGLLYYAKKFETENIKILNEKFWSPKASNVFKLGTQMASEGKFVDPVELVPLYIRRPEAEENLEKQKNSEP
ncbi:MAG: tRNA (adenosine(37)-N6)-threonylcarbamoyltransferase complex dimerization subunit type 1 TsaB [Planctomycetes bacterium GWF2_41_51]|nr:MAG: tRNA (adenosine(37)-N6)-threonylcarbamoyltransferase complex dimerization subunit type 1 TsaB [Planctomycetes bacterium GWF2_41_51]HBG26861.1 tRNA (adenosine(37)-N6)-threonylcarbamoyltransferase complex dimerization subunit type 1 TsaB [Phycisphaerales bacterium]